MPGWPHHYLKMEHCVATYRIYALQKKSINRLKYVNQCLHAANYSIQEENVKASDCYYYQFSWSCSVGLYFYSVKALYRNPGPYPLQATESNVRSFNRINSAVAA